jgi:hypothetical protein
MMREIDLIELPLDQAALLKLGPRRRNQLIGCMHAHNELSVFNRLLLFAMTDTGSGPLHDNAQSVQIWTLLQILAGKLFETWIMLKDRFLGADPVDPTVDALDPEHKASLDIVRSYFAEKHNALATIRDKAAFHYDRLDLATAVDGLHPPECCVYLAQHPVNSLYFTGSTLVFRAVFLKIAERLPETVGLDQDHRMKLGFQATIGDATAINTNMHLALYGLIKTLLHEQLDTHALGENQIRLRVVDIPTPREVALPCFIDIEQT